jgi:arylsulfatase A-like enzyme
MTIARAAAAAVLACLLVAAPAAAGTTAGGRPNVVVIETDDQTASTLWAMPIVQRVVADRGVTFDNSFVSFSLCCPSRATFLTGQYAHNHRVFDNVLPYGSFYRLDSSNTLPVWLQAAGYRTMQVGKYLNRYGTRDPFQVPPGWSDWHALVDPSTYRYFGFTMNDDGRLAYYPPSPANYSTDVIARKATGLIADAAAGPRPFFLWTTFLAPHFSLSPIPEPDDPLVMRTPEPAPQDRNRFAWAPLPRDPSFNEKDVRDKPTDVQAFPRLSATMQAAIQENYQQELETLQAVDRAVGRIVDTLQRTGQLAHTLIVFTSDNGYYHGEHRIPREKILPYEPAIRVPLVVSGPGLPRGAHRSQLVSNQDLASTILDAAGARPGLAQDGISLLPLMRDPRVDPGRDLLIESYYHLPVPTVVEGIRTPAWFYTWHSDGQHELYDLVADPYELRNRFGEPAYARVQAELDRRLLELRACSGASCLKKNGPVTR